MKAFTKWWIQFVAILYTCGMMEYFNWWEFMWDSDKTKITIMILAMFVIASIVMGYLSFKGSREDMWDRADRLENYVMFAADTMITLGMLGTLIGFLLMLNTAFIDLDVNDVKNVQTAIANMAIGMSTALVTTLVGMVCSTLTRMQLLVYDHSSGSELIEGEP